MLHSVYIMCTTLFICKLIILSIVWWLCVQLKMYVWLSPWMQCNIGLLISTLFVLQTSLWNTIICSLFWIVLIFCGLYVGRTTWRYVIPFPCAGQNIRKLVKDGFIIRKPQKIHSRSRARRANEAKQKGRHSGYGTPVQNSSRLSVQYL
jgi:hypothetical protein